MSMLDTLFWPFVVGLLGVLAHILKRARVDGEGWEALTGYMRGHLISIVLTLIGCVVQIAIAHEMGTLNLYAAFLAGFCSDSVFIKAAKSGGIKFPKV